MTETLFYSTFKIRVDLLYFFVLAYAFNPFRVNGDMFGVKRQEK